MNEESYQIGHSFEVFRDLSPRAAASSESCEKALKGREAEQNSWQSDEGEGQELNILRGDDATRRREVFRSEIGSIPGRAFIRNSPGKAEISPGIKKSEQEAKDERLEEAWSSPVPSPISHFPPQGFNLEAVAPSQPLE